MEGWRQYEPAPEPCLRRGAWSCVAWRRCRRRRRGGCVVWRSGGASLRRVCRQRRDQGLHSEVDCCGARRRTASQRQQVAARSRHAHVRAPRTKFSISACSPKRDTSRCTPCAFTTSTTFFPSHATRRSAPVRRERPQRSRAQCTHPFGSVGPAHYCLKREVAAAHGVQRISVREKAISVAAARFSAALARCAAAPARLPVQNAVSAP